MKIDTILERGKFIRKCAHPETLAYFPENREAVKDLYSKYRFEYVLGRDGKPLAPGLSEWIIPGSKGNVWEYGVEMLGFSVNSGVMQERMRRETKDFAQMTQNGDGEANFKFLYSPENMLKVAGMLKLRIRRRISQ